MSLVVSVSVVPLPQQQQGFERRLGPGDSITLGRALPGTSSNRLVIPSGWLGLRADAMVSAELLRLAFLDVDGDCAVIGWRTRSSLHPAVLRLTTSLDGEPDIETEGQVRLRGAGVGRLYVLRLVRQEQRFVPQLLVRLQVVRRVATVSQAVDIGATLTAAEYSWGDLVEEWWTPRRPAGREGAGLSWRRCLEASARCVDVAPAGRLAAEVTCYLQARGDRQVNERAVRKAWNRAIRDLVSALRDPDLRWMVEALALPGLADLVGRSADEVTDERVPSGEPEIRRLIAALRSTGEWDWR